MTRRPRIVGGIGVAAAAVVLFAAACSNAPPETVGPSTSSPPGSPVPSPTSVTTPPPDSPSPSPSELLPDGRNFGFIKSIDASTQPATLVFDLAYFYPGAQADEEARKDGVIGPGEHVPDDYYIVNRNPLLRTVPIASGVTVKAVDWTNCCEPVTYAFAGLVQAFPPAGAPTDALHGPESAYWLTVSGGQIVAIEEQYLP